MHASPTKHVTYTINTQRFTSISWIWHGYSKGSERIQCTYQVVVALGQSYDFLVANVVMILTDKNELIVISTQKGKQSIYIIPSVLQTLHSFYMETSLSVCLSVCWPISSLPVYAYMK